MSRVSFETEELSFEGKVVEKALRTPGGRSAARVSPARRTTAYAATTKRDDDEEFELANNSDLVSRQLVKLNEAGGTGGSNFGKKVATQVEKLSPINIE